MDATVDASTYYLPSKTEINYLFQLSHGGLLDTWHSTGSFATELNIENDNPSNLFLKSTKLNLIVSWEGGSAAGGGR